MVRVGPCYGDACLRYGPTASYLVWRDSVAMPIRLCCWPAAPRRSPGRTRSANGSPPADVGWSVTTYVTAGARRPSIRRCPGYTLRDLAADALGAATPSGLSTRGFDPAGFPSLLPGLLTATRIGLTPASDDELRPKINYVPTSSLLVARKIEARSGPTLAREVTVAWSPRFYRPTAGVLLVSGDTVTARGSGHLPR
jgi:hypothetical protein